MRRGLGRAGVAGRSAQPQRDPGQRRDRVRPGTGALDHAVPAARGALADKRDAAAVAAERRPALPLPPADGALGAAVAPLADPALLYFQPFRCSPGMGYQVGPWLSRLSLTLRFVDSSCCTDAHVKLFIKKFFIIAATG